MHVLILDLTHGGDILTEEFLKKEYTVTCVDVYRIATRESMEALRKKGAEVCHEVPVGNYDLLVSPAHCPDSFLNTATFEKRMTFSQAVNMFIDDKRFRIEVTGVKGKTSFCYLLAHILCIAGKSVFLHTSRGRGPWKNGVHEITENMSIAPTSLLRLPSDDYDIMIEEVSLGGSGKADIAVITNIIDDYGIARNTRKASDAKADILTNGINIVCRKELEFWKGYGERTFYPYGGNVSAIVGGMKIGTPLELRVCYNGSQSIELDKGYLSLQYLQAIDAVTETCEAMDIPTDAVINGLKTFKGVPGRGEISFENGRWHVRERNPGISHISIGMTLECLKKMGALDNAVVIIDPVNRKVCDKMDMDSISEVVSKYGAKMYFTSPDGPRPEIADGVTTVVEFIKEAFQ